MKDPEEILKENPGSVVFARYGEELARKGRIEEAIEVLTAGIEANPSYTSGYYVLSDIYASKGMHEESANLLERVLFLDPQAPRAHFKLGQYLLEVDPDRAREHLRIAQRFEGDTPKVHALRAEASPGASVEPDHETGPDEAVSKAPELRNKRMPGKIVLAEDESHIARLITFKLEKEGYELTWAKDGGEALEKITEIMPDLVILDVMMPVMDGFEVLKKVKHDETLKAIPVIMLTARGQDNDIVHGLETGAADYIVKPFRPAELLARIRRIIG